MALADGAAVFEKGFFDGLRPDPVLTVSEWADRHRYLSQRASAGPEDFKHPAHHTCGKSWTS